MPIVELYNDSRKFLKRLNFRPLFILSLHTQEMKYLLAVSDFLTNYV